MESFDLKLWDGFLSASNNQYHQSTIVDQITIDSRLIHSKNSLFVALPGLKEDGHHFLKQAEDAGAAFAIVKKEWRIFSQKSSLKLLYVDNPLLALQEIATSYRKQMKAFVIAITGTHGKTMVKDLLLNMLGSQKNVVASPGSFNSQIGVPLSLLRIKNDTEIALIEAAISQKGEMDRLANLILPNGSILTHLGKKHLATMGDMQNLTSEILKLITKSEQEWTLVPKAPLMLPYLEKITQQTYFWNLDSPNLPHANSLSEHFSSTMKYELKFPDNSLHEGCVTAGFYYFMDLLNISIKAAWILGIPPDSIIEVVKNYTLEPSRTEIWKSSIGTTFINDKYAADAQSIDVALKYYDQAQPKSRRIFIFGGIRGKKDNFLQDKQIAHSIIKNKVHQLALVGSQEYSNVKDVILKEAPHIEIKHYPSYQDAYQEMKDVIKQEDFVLIKGEKKQPLDNLTEMFNDSVSTNQCFINLAAIQSNIHMIRNKLKSGTRIMVIVKAFAYGTDEIRVGKFLSSCGVDFLGVSYVDEAIVLRRAGAKQSIFVINAPLYEVVKVVKWDLEVGVSEKDFIIALAKQATKQSKTIKVHLHIDTGMSRLGCRPEKALELAQCIKNCPSLELEGIMTHFACADDASCDDFTLLQAQRFDDVVLELKKNGIEAKWIHAANSSAAIRFDFPQYNMVRIGLAVYGLYCSDAAKKGIDLRLALTLVSRVVGINECNQGDTISYGRSYVVDKDKQKIAVLPIGYFDGLHRNYSGKGYVIIRGQKAPMVGKICMDFMMVDVTDIKNVSIGDSVLIFGEDEYGQYLPPESLAHQGDSIVHELITCLGPRIQRVFINEEANQER